VDTAFDVDKGLPEVVGRKLNPIQRYGVRASLFALALVLVGIPFGLLLHEVVSSGPLTVLDEGTAQWLNRHVAQHPLAVTALDGISLLGKPITLFVIVGIPAVWLYSQGSRKLVLFLAVTCIGGGVVDSLVKLAVGRPRPTVDEPVATAIGKSFPSGHSMSSTICYGALLLVFLPMLGRAGRVRAIAVTIVVVFAIGTSRLMLGVHFLSDVLGGYVLGLAWLVASVAAFEIWREERGRRTTAPMDEGVEPEEARKVHAVRGSGASASTS